MEAQSKRTRLADIAKQVDVSITTVSYVLSGNERIGISEATKQRILETAKSLGYKRDGLSMAFRSGKTGILGLVCPEPYSQLQKAALHPWFGELAVSMSLSAQTAGFQLALSIGQQALGLTPEQLGDRRFDGVVLLYPQDETWANAVLATGIPCVEIGSKWGDYSVSVDAAAGYSAALQHLNALRHQRIAYVRGVAGNPLAERRLLAFQSAAQYVGLSAQNLSVYSSLEEMLRGMESTGFPTAVLFFNDLQACQGLKLLRESDVISVRDLSFIGFDNLAISAQIDPPLTTIQTPFESIAESAIRLLSMQINNVTGADKQVVLPTYLVMRESTSPPDRFK